MFFRNLGLALLISVVAGCLTYFISNKHEAGDFISWRSLGKPSGSVATITGTTLDSVTVKTLSGKYYSCEIAAQDNCWRETDGNSTLESSCANPDALPKPSGDITEVHSACMGHVGGIFVSSYALKADGIVYVWNGRWGGGEWSGIIILLNSLGAALLGFIGTILFFAIQWVKARSTTSG